jgi:hypothetical protein
MTNLHVRVHNYPDEPALYWYNVKDAPHLPQEHDLIRIDTADLSIHFDARVGYVGWRSDFKVFEVDIELTELTPEQLTPFADALGWTAVAESGKDTGDSAVKKPPHLGAYSF